MEVGWTDAAVQTEVEAMTVLTDKPEVGQTDAALLVEELAKGWHRAKKGKMYLIDWMSFTIAGVQYLYLEPKHESFLSMTHYNFWHKRKHS